MTGPAASGTPEETGGSAGPAASPPTETDAAGGADVPREGVDVPPEPDGAHPGPPGPWACRALALVWYAVPLMIYMASRAAQVWLIAWMAPANSDSGVVDRLVSWDTGWFVRVARDGYPSGYTFDTAGHLTGNGLAFFPAFPMLVRGVHEATGASYEMSALVAGTFAGCLATLAVYALGRHLYDRRVGIVLAALFCTQPMSVVLSMGYSEGLFVAFAAVALVAAYRNAWLVAGVAGLGAALSRPTGAAVALALLLAAVFRLRSAPSRSRRWRVVAGTLVALAGVPAFLAWVGLRAGSWRAWFDIQTVGWGTTFDWGASTADFVTGTLRDGDGWVPVSVAWLLVVAVLLAVAAVARRVWPPLLLYGLLSLVLVIGQGGYYHSKPRLLVPVLLVLVPPAVALGRSRIRLALPAVAGCAAFGLWYGAYMITVWRFAI